MPTPQHRNPEHSNPLTERTQGTFQTDQHRNTRNTSSLGKAICRIEKCKFCKAGLGSGQFDQTQTTPKAGKAATAAFPAGQTASQHRIQYPPSVCKLKRSRQLRRGVTEL